MAVSLGGILFSVGMNTSGFESGAKKVIDLEAKMKNELKKSLNEQIKETNKLKKLRDEVEQAKADYMKQNQALTDTSTKEEKRAVDQLFKSYKKLESAYEKAEEKLKEKIHLNKVNNQQMREEIAEAKKLAKAQRGLNAVKGFFKSGLGIGSIGVAFTMAYNSLKETADKLDALSKRARDIGITASQLQEFEHQAKLAGISTGALDSSIKAFNRNISLASMGTGEAKTALEEMGISLTNANGGAKTQSELLKETAKYFSVNSYNAKNAGYSARIFGESGVELLRIFEQGEEVINKVFNAKGIDEAAEAAERYNDAMENVSNVWFKFKSGVIGYLSDYYDFYTHDIFNDDMNDAKVQRYVKKINEETKKQQAKLLQMQAERVKAEEEQTKKDLENYEKVEEAQKKLDESRMSDFEKIKKLQEEIRVLRLDIIGLDEFDEKFIDKRVKTLEKTLELETLIKNVNKEKTDDIKKAFDVLDAEAKADKKKAEDEAKKLADKQKEILLARQEFELQFRISKLEKGTDKEKLEAQAIKNAVKRNELMKKYGYDIETATRAMKAMREIGDDVKYQYSESDVKKAKRVVERSQKGKNVGKKTLEQAQAILNGQALKKDRVAMFSDVKAMDMQFANIPAGTTSPVNMVGATATATPTLSATPTQQANSNDIFQQILDAINGIPDLLGNQLKEVFSE